MQQVLAHLHAACLQAGLPLLMQGKPKHQRLAVSLRQPQLGTILHKRQQDMTADPRHCDSTEHERRLAACPERTSFPPLPLLVWGGMPSGLTFLDRKFYYIECAHLLGLGGPLSTDAMIMRPLQVIQHNYIPTCFQD